MSAALTYFVDFVPGGRPGDPNRRWRISTGDLGTGTTGVVSWHFTQAFALIAACEAADSMARRVKATPDRPIQVVVNGRNGEPVFTRNYPPDRSGGGRHARRDIKQGVKA